MTTVRIHIQDLEAGQGQRLNYFEADWNLPRNHRYTYLTDSKGLDACEEAFTIFNAPEDYLEEWQKYIQRGYKGPSVSVGDIVEVDGVDYLCCSAGWQKRPDQIDWNGIEKEARRKAFKAQEDVAVPYEL